MLSLNLCYGVHYLECENLYDGVMKIYLNPSESGILLHYPARVSFRGEDTIVWWCDTRSILLFL